MDRRSFIQRVGVGTGCLLLAESGLSRGNRSLSNQERLADLSSKPLTRVAFGSCNKSLEDQSYWNLIARDQPELWIWLGDNVYSDFTSPSLRSQLYQNLKSNLHYERFRALTPVIGTWDDHDYGGNGSDKNFADKESSKRTALAFLDVPADAPVWDHSGIYQTYSFGPQGQRIQIILLDNRYNLDKNTFHKRLLGDEQWEWLEQTVRSSDADLLIFGSGLNMTSPLSAGELEGWNSFSQERDRFYHLIAEASIPTIVISGDRHFAEMTKTLLPGGQPLFEVMSSGLTHCAAVPLPHPGHLNLPIVQKNYGLLTVEWMTSGPLVKLEIKSAERYQSLAAVWTDFSR